MRSRPFNPPVETDAPWEGIFRVLGFDRYEPDDLSKPDIRSLLAVCARHYVDTVHDTPKMRQTVLRILEDLRDQGIIITVPRRDVARTMSS